MADDELRPKGYGNLQSAHWCNARQEAGLWFTLICTHIPFGTVAMGEGIRRAA